MFKGLRDGYFALGLTIGLGIGVISVLFLEYHSPPINGYSSTNTHCAAQDYQCQDYHDSGPYWGYWFRRLISTEDSLAQWIMMVFTIAGALLLYLTLTASRSMAKDAREIGQAQARAYLSLEIAEVNIVINSTGDGHTANVAVSCHAVNRGQSPAITCKIFFDISQADNSEKTMKTDGSEMFASGRSLQHIAAGSKTNHLLQRFFKIDNASFLDNTSPIRFSYVIEYRDVFKNEIKAPLSSGTFMKAVQGNWIFVADIVTYESDD